MQLRNIATMLAAVILLPLAMSPPAVASEIGERPDELARPGDEEPDDPFAESLARVELVAHDSGVELQGYDENDEPVGVITLTYGENGEIHIAQEYDDGWAEAVVIPGTEPVWAGNLAPATLELRAARFGDLLELSAPGDAPAEKNSWPKCARWLVSAAIGCGAARPLACVGGAIQAACTCVPMIDKDSRKFECPWNA